MSGELETYSGFVLKQGAQQIERMSLGASLISSVVDAISGRGNRELRKYELDLQRIGIERQSMLEFKRLECAKQLELERLGIEKSRIELQQKELEARKEAFDRLIDASMEMFNGKLNSLNVARMEYTRFYEGQLNEVNRVLGDMMLARDRADLKEYSQLTSSITRLTECKENLMSQYNRLMIELDYRIAELKIENIGVCKSFGLENKEGNGGAQ